MNNGSVAIRGDNVIINGQSVYVITDSPFTQFIVDVYAPTLRGVSVSSGSFENFETLIVPSFETRVSGSGRITGIIDSRNFSARISGSGRITPLGRSENADILITGSGSFRGNDFITNSATARVTGSGNVNIHAINSLNANVTGSGNIRYRGNPRVDSRVSGSGRVRSANLSLLFR